ncbi:acetyl-CoA acetyltransferase [Pseudorhodoferax sp. Leaf274]|uniref:acetyl-CoA acetyltransferase n=1 Tax=Pseudorhodoferax sp. Leaf274 TaxID=1736318 RepID=UPI0007027343|nr:acetyl-CoA acetyltransferase [Pseudorhodoferax sp. Leaf274]KQP35693.1 acetyl-CoA acetyltransferase [Pseudorhodoferax sp. Leaf274]
MTRVLADNTPILVGIGEAIHRSKAPPGLEPLALMEQSLRAAEHDAGVPLLAGLDALDVVCEYSWPYTDAPGLLAARLGCRPAHLVYGETGGESPVRFIHEAALRIARGESQVAAIVGAEARYTVDAAAKAGVALPWTPRDDSVKLVRGTVLCHPVAVQLGAFMPTTIYPFYENATLAHWGLTPRAAHEESARLWARYSEVAAGNPHAWLQRRFTPEEVAEPGPANRLIAWPYTKHMVANPVVNMGAAVVLTSVGRARALGIAEARWVHIWGGAAAREPRDYLQRDHYVGSHAQDLVMETVLAHAGGDAAAFDMLELYSCFPVVPKMARRTLGLAADARMTSTGGLSFFGAPLNNYMTHAACGLVRALRAAPGKAALLYGQGEYVTKHHALVLGAGPSPHGALSENYSVQAAADARRGPVPPLVLEHSGSARLETFTVIYGRDGAATHGVVIARTKGGGRLMARLSGADAAGIAVLTDADASPVGRMGRVAGAADGLLEWSFA